MTAFSRTDVAATFEQAAEVRQEIAGWLHAVLPVEAEKSSDVVLAVYEAMSNAAEFAYAHAEASVMHIRAFHDTGLDMLTVAVTDEGRWQTKDPAVPDNPARGRGIPLMQALSDRAAINATDAGTQVRLQWDHIGAPTGAAAC